MHPGRAFFAAFITWRVLASGLIDATWLSWAVGIFGGVIAISALLPGGEGTEEASPRPASEVAKVAAIDAPSHDPGPLWLGPKVDVNNARVGEMESLPGVDVSLAREIAAKVEEYDGFSNFAELESAVPMSPDVAAGIRGAVEFGARSGESATLGSEAKAPPAASDEREASQPRKSGRIVDF